jgi:hypothetical protein
LNHYTKIASGETLTVKGTDFAGGAPVTLYQCNENSLNDPDGDLTSSNCDLNTTVTITSAKNGSFTESFTVVDNSTDPAVGRDIGCIDAHISGWFIEAWGWACWGAGTNATVTSPTETWYSPQPVAVKGYSLPKVAKGTEDVAVECNPNFLSGDPSSCDETNAVVLAKGKGTLSVVMGTVGDGTCGTGSSDELCYIVVANINESTGVSTVVNNAPIDFYESSTT